MMTVWQPWEMTVFVMALMGISNYVGYYLGKIKGIEITLRHMNDADLMRVMKGDDEDGSND